MEDGECIFQIFTLHIFMIYWLSHTQEQSAYVVNETEYPVKSRPDNKVIGADKFSQIRMVALFKFMKSEPRIIGVRQASFRRT